jgi:plastocyanin
MAQAIDEGRSEAMNRWSASLLVGGAFVIGGCGAGAPRVTPVSPSAALASPLAGSPLATPAAALNSTTETASQAPAGAIAIAMITLPNARPRYEPDNATARAGTVTFFLENIPYPPFAPNHDMLIGPAIYEALAWTPAIRVNQKVAFTVHDLRPGRYVFWCSVKDVGNELSHAGQGMVGTLTINP